LADFYLKSTFFFGGEKPLASKKGQNRFQNFPEIFQKIGFFERPKLNLFNTGGTNLFFSIFIY